MIYLIIFLLVALDQITKYLSIQYLKGEGSVSFLPGFIELKYTENTGAAFSILEGQTILFVLITVAVLIFIFFMIKTKKVKHITGKVASIIIISGAIGNLIDRILHGFVVDMFNFTFMNFAIFNVADIYITIGGMILCVYILFYYDKDNLEKINE